MPLAETMKIMKTSDGSDVFTLSQQKLIFLVFLRHFGCVFCRESLLDLSKKRNLFSQNGLVPVFVHMTDEPTAESYFQQYQLGGVTHVADPECKFYLSFGLVKGRFNQLFGLKSLSRGFEIAATKGIFPTVTMIGDGYQMPGIFLIKNGKVLDSYIHAHAWDKPDYDNLIRCCAL
ncbi:MAG: redoxin domain-containing protein [Saprospiraceae bacterium]|nr:redoxin domain-containing protein [Saprospiraceae bacterium]